MAENFSEEYIQEVTTKMPHVQAYWQKRGVQTGDYCVGQNKLNQGLVGIVLWHKTKSADSEFGYIGGWAVSELVEGDLHWYCNKAKHLVEDWCWLPALSNLLEMLKELSKGCQLSLTFYTTRKPGHQHGAWRWCGPYGKEGLLVDEKRDFGPDWELAAACLLAAGSGRERRAMKEGKLYCHHCGTTTIHGREKLHSAPNQWEWVWRCYVCGHINKMFKADVGPSGGKVKAQKDSVAVTPAAAIKREETE